MSRKTKIDQVIQITKNRIATLTNKRISLDIDLNRIEAAISELRDHLTMLEKVRDTKDTNRKA